MLSEQLSEAIPDKLVFCRFCGRAGREAGDERVVWIVLNRVRLYIKTVLIHVNLSNASDVESNSLFFRGVQILPQKR